MKKELLRIQKQASYLQISGKPPNRSVQNNRQISQSTITESEIIESSNINQHATTENRKRKLFSGHGNYLNFWKRNHSMKRKWEKKTIVDE